MASHGDHRHGRRRPPPPSLQPRCFNATVAILSYGTAHYAELAVHAALDQEPAEVLVLADSRASLRHLARSTASREPSTWEHRDANGSLLNPREQPAQPFRLRLVLVDGSQTIGRKRDIGCRVATAEVVVHWDDDDLYGPNRLEAQVLPIANRAAGLSLLQMSHIGLAKLGRVRAQHFTSTTMFASMAYRRSICAEVGGFPDASLGEDQWFCEAAVRACHHVTMVRGVEALYTRTRHSTAPDPYPIAHDEPYDWRFPRFFTPRMERKWVRACRLHRRPTGGPPPQNPAEMFSSDHFSRASLDGSMPPWCRRGGTDASDRLQVR